MTLPHPVPNPGHKKRRPVRSGGFSLLEMIVVITIIALLGAMAVPALNQVTSSLSLTQAGQTINDQLVQARQQATALNTGTELRFVVEDNVDKGGWAYRSVQLWQLDRRGNGSKPLGRLEELPVAAIINPDLSDLLAGLQKNTADFPGVGQRSYVGLRYRPNGRLEIETTLAKACITVQMRHSDRSQPANYYTLQINPLTGRIATYRP